ncbi:hypothetical protein T484DRAFT_1942913 [Baffinella frigidus]|nr:hypothetical protein T484DRAFT_1942913 [Cryptophyta sp. CCMP2293]
MVRSAGLAVIALAAVPTAAAFLPAPANPLVLRSPSASVRAAASSPMMVSSPVRREALGIFAAGLLGAAAGPPPVFAEGWGAQFRKSITGEVKGEERAYVREEKAAKGEGDVCGGAYQCFDVNEDTEGGKFARATFDAVSFLAPTGWTKADAAGQVAGSWSDGKGGVVAIMVRSTEGITMRDTASVGAMSDSINKLGLAQVGSKIAKERGYTNTGGKARKIKGISVPIYSLGMKSPETIEAMDVVSLGPQVYILSCTAPVDKWDLYKQDFNAILTSISFTKPAEAEAAPAP